MKYFTKIRFYFTDHWYAEYYVRFAQANAWRKARVADLGLILAALALASLG